ncbi:MAG: hypothetical protein R2798_13635 [Chitinophagales bacterium]|nr:hypothetical protein [Bacteroidota bacterium]MCB9044207.1 hypothetical protein [Chitinophagales bacterium]
MKYNLNFKDIILHYVIMIVIVMIGALTKIPAIMFFALPFFIIALTGMSPIYTLLGIDHSDHEDE